MASVGLVLARHRIPLAGVSTGRGGGHDDLTLTVGSTVGMKASIRINWTSTFVPVEIVIVAASAFALTF